MSALVTADLHWNDNPRDAYRHQFVGELLKLAREHKPDCLMILGDLTDDKDRHSASLVNTIAIHARRLADAFRRVIILKGNHDYVDARLPFFEFLGMMPGVTYVSQPSAINTSELALDDENLPPRCLLLPHTYNYRRDWEHLGKMDGWAYIFAHNAFDGASWDGQRVVENGVPPSVFPDDVQVVSGDIHRPQTINTPGNNIHYVGAPYAVDFGDAWTPRVLLLDGPGWNSLPVGGPQKRLVSVVSLDELDDQRLNEGDILKVQAWLDPHEADKWPERVAAVRAWGERNGYVIHAVQPVMPVMIGRERDVPAATRRSDEQLLEDYAADRAVDERTVKTGRLLMRKA